MVNRSSPKGGNEDAGLGAVPVDSRLPASAALHDINIAYQDLEGLSVSHDAHSSWAALLCSTNAPTSTDRVSMRMTDFHFSPQRRAGRGGEVAADPRESIRCLSTWWSAGRAALDGSHEISSSTALVLPA